MFHPLLYSCSISMLSDTTEVSPLAGLRMLPRYILLILLDEDMYSLFFIIIVIFYTMGQSSQK